MRTGHTPCPPPRFLGRGQQPLPRAQAGARPHHLPPGEQELLGRARLLRLQLLLPLLSTVLPVQALDGPGRRTAASGYGRPPGRAGAGLSTIPLVQPSESALRQKWTARSLVFEQAPWRLAGVRGLVGHTPKALYATELPPPRKSSGSRVVGSRAQPQPGSCPGITPQLTGAARPQPRV